MCTWQLDTSRLSCVRTYCTVCTYCIHMYVCTYVLYCMYILYARTVLYVHTVYVHMYVHTVYIRTVLYVHTVCTYCTVCMYILYTYIRMSWCRDRKVDSLADNTQQLDQAKSMIQKLQQEVRSWPTLCVSPARCTIQGNLLSVNLKGDTKSVLFVRGTVLTYYQG